MHGVISSQTKANTYVCGIQSVHFSGPAGDSRCGFTSWRPAQRIRSCSRRTRACSGSGFVCHWNRMHLHQSAPANPLPIPTRLHASPRPQTPLNALPNLPLRALLGAKRPFPLAFPGFSSEGSSPRSSTEEARDDAGFFDREPGSKRWRSASLNQESPPRRGRCSRRRPSPTRHPPNRRHRSRRS